MNTQQKDPITLLRLGSVEAVIAQAKPWPNKLQCIEVDAPVFESLVLQGLLIARFHQFWVEGTRTEVVLIRPI